MLWVRIDYVLLYIILEPIYCYVVVRQADDVSYDQNNDNQTIRFIIKGFVLAELRDKHSICVHTKSTDKLVKVNKE